MWARWRTSGGRPPGGYFRQPFASAERECVAWFVAGSGSRALEVEEDGNGNLVAWWRAGSGDAVLTGSHLDSVLDGGAYDGPLGVVSAFAAIDVAGPRSVPSRPIGVGAFVEEEGSRFGIACLGSRLATGSISAASARDLRDRDGVFLLDAMAAAGLSPSLGPSPC